MYDLVYPLKNPTETPELKYSLRSVCKYANFGNVYFVGYKPSWAKDVIYIPTQQTGTKYQNSTNNLLTVCKFSKLSDDFILMNDDFFCLKPVIDWKSELNRHAGDIKVKVNKAKIEGEQASMWLKAFLDSQELLQKFGATTFNYELHIPIILNKNTFLEMMDIPEIKERYKKARVIQKRTLYKNLYPDENPVYLSDVKMPQNKDVIERYANDHWFSTYDGVFTNKNLYPKTIEFLETTFNEPCRYEKG